MQALKELIHSFYPDPNCDDNDKVDHNHSNVRGFHLENCVGMSQSPCEAITCKQNTKMLR